MAKSTRQKEKARKIRIAAEQKAATDATKRKNIKAFADSGRNRGPTKFQGPVNSVPKVGPAMPSGSSNRIPGATTFIDQGKAARDARNASPMSKAFNSGKGLLGKAGNVAKYVGKIPGIGLLGTAARIGTPIGLAGSALYYGARGLGYDPFGEDTRGPTPIGYDVNNQPPPPVTAPEARWQQTFRPDSSATGKELINAALFRAAMQGNMADRGAAAASVLVDKDKYRTGAEALAAGMENLGDQAQVSVSQDKDGFYQYYGKVDNSLNLLNKVNNSLRAIDKTEYDSMVARMLQVKPDATEQDILDTLEENGVSYTPQEVE